MHEYDNQSFRLHVIVLYDTIPVPLRVRAVVVVHQWVVCIMAVISEGDNSSMMEIPLADLLSYLSALLLR